MDERLVAWMMGDDPDATRYEVCRSVELYQRWVTGGGMSALAREWGMSSHAVEAVVRGVAANVERLRWYLEGWRDAARGGQ